MNVFLHKHKTGNDNEFKMTAHINAISTDIKERARNHSEENIARMLSFM